MSGENKKAAADLIHLQESTGALSNEPFKSAEIFFDFFIQDRFVDTGSAASRRRFLRVLLWTTKRLPSRQRRMLISPACPEGSPVFIFSCGPAFPPLYYRVFYDCVLYHRASYIIPQGPQAGPASYTG